MKRYKLLSILLVILLSFSLAACKSTEAESRGSGEVVSHEFVVLSTTDMHGRSTARDVASGAEVNNSMLRVASAVKEVRDEYPDAVILVDNGDTIQGNLTAQYAINYRPDELNPMIEELIKIGYNAWGLGNHEFNFLPEARNRQVEYAMDAGINVLAANITLVEDGLNVHGEEAKSGDPFYDPYAVYTIDFKDGNTLKIALIGLSNAANHTWDLETNYPNLRFSSKENPDGILEYEIDKWVGIVKEKENPDFIIVTAHSGKGTDDGVSADFLLEGQALTGARNSSDISLLIYGHDHSANIETVTAKDGKSLDIVNGGGDAVTKTVFEVTFAPDGSIMDFVTESELLPLDQYEDDEELSSEVQHWFDDAYAWASAPLGTFTGGWDEIKYESENKSNNDMVLSENSLMNLIHKAQIWSTWQSYESEGIEGATVSIASAVFAYDRATGYITFVPSDGDTISTLELSQLYRYSNNLMCAVEMSGEELYAWMNKVADMYALKEDGTVGLGEGVSIYGLDTFYGVDYIIDLSKPMGERLVQATINGEDVKDIPSIKVALNSYRLSGGYGFYEATGHTEADCFWTASQYLGSDRSPVPTQIGEYVAAMKSVTPYDEVSHGFDSSWAIIY